MEYDIEFTNYKTPSVRFSEAGEELRQEVECIQEKYTALFEDKFADSLRDCTREDWGGLIVYTSDNKVCAVYDYESFVGWVE